MADASYANRTTAAPGADALKIGGPGRMCDRYAPPRPNDVVQRWCPRQAVVNFPPRPILPRAHGSFIRASQDKRSDVPIELADVDQWLLVTVDEAAALVRLAPLEVFAAGPAM